MKYKLKILLLSFLCLLRYVIFGKATRKQKEFKKIVIFQGAKLGDMVCTTPVFRAVKEKYPKCKLIVIGNEVNKKLLEYNSNVDDYIAHKDENIFATIKKIRKENPDFGCITGPGFLNLAILYLAGIPLIAAPVVEDGICPLETKSYKIIRSLVKTCPHHMGRYAPREYLRLLEIIDIYAEDTKKYLAFSKKADISAEKFFEEKSILQNDFLVGISPSAGNKIKEWPVNRFAEVADYIIDKYGARILLFGGSQDEDIVKDMIGYIKNQGSVIDVQGVFNLDELKAMISRLKLFISVDTGPVYIAEAFEVPTIDIVGPMDEREQPPVGKFHKMVVAPRKTAQLHVMNARLYDEEEARRQVESLTSATVINEVDALLQELKVAEYNGYGIKFQS